MIKTFNVIGMTCNACDMLVSEALEDVEGVDNVTSNHKEGKVIVDYDESILSITTIIDVIEEEGFKVE